MTAEFDYFEVTDVSRIESEPDQCPLFLPSVISGCSGVYVEHIEIVVVHDFENMAVAGYHQSGSVLSECLFHPRGVSSGISAYMPEMYPHPFGLEVEYLRTPAAYEAVVDVAAYCPYHRRYVFELLYDGYIAHIACVPDLIAAGEMCRIPVIPA